MLLKGICLDDVRNSETPCTEFDYFKKLSVLTQALYMFCLVSSMSDSVAL